ncbi:MAG: iron donor protein CyaY [Plesiomonas sp.]|uniref:iron donor protein CyaY n=1 Tax=Plesiomonas sp. TaxID=2486279 RepID=UPI003F334139
MNDSQFHQYADLVWHTLEEKLDDIDTDIDYENQGGVMTLTFEDGSKIILNRQEPLHQIWVATKFGGFHFDFSDEEWICNRSGAEFWTFLSLACSTQSGEEVSLQFT